MLTLITNNCNTLILSSLQLDINYRSLVKTSQYHSLHHEQNESITLEGVNN